MVERVVVGETVVGGEQGSGSGEDGKTEARTKTQSRASPPGAASRCEFPRLVLPQPTPRNNRTQPTTISTDLALRTDLCIIPHVQLL